RQRPISRWISVPRESVWPVLGQALRCGVDAGSMTYSAVIQPPGRDGPNQGGNSCATDAVHQTTVPPCSHRTEPAAARGDLRVIFTGRKASFGRPSGRIGGGYSRGDTTAIETFVAGPGVGLAQCAAQHQP